MSNNNLKLAVEIESKVSNISEAKQYIEKLEQMGINVDHLRKRSKLLAEAWDTLKPRERAQRMRRLREVMSETAAGTLDLEKETNELAKANKNAAKTTKKLTEKSTELNGTYSKLRKAVVGVGVAFVAYFSVSKISSFFTGAVGGAAELEAQLDKVQAVSGATNEEMARIEKTATKLGASTKYTAVQSAEGFEILARAGLNANQSIETLPSVLALAQASGMDLAESAGYITKAVAGMNLKTSNTSRVADVLAKAAASANTEVAGLGQGLSYAAPSASSLGVSLENTVAILGKFADAGIDASRSGTALNSIMSQFSNPASKFKQELSAIGINTNDFVEALRQLEGAGESGSQAILAVGQEAGPALKAMLAQGMESVDELSAKLMNAGGSAQEMASVMNNNLQGSFLGLASAWESFKNALGKPFLNIITSQVNKLATVIRDFVSSGQVEQLGKYFADTFGAMSQSVIDFVKSFALDDTTNQINNFVSSTISSFKKVGAGFSLTFNILATGFNTIKATITGVASVVTGAIASIISGMAKLASITPFMDDIAASLKETAGGMKAVSDAFADSAQKALNSAAQSGEKVAEAMKTITASTNESTVALKDNQQVTEQSTAVANDLKTTIEGVTQATQEQAAAFKNTGQATQEATKALSELGLSAQQLQTGISESAQTSIQQFRTAAQQFGTDANKMQQIFSAATQKMSSPQEFNALKSEFEKVAESAGLPAEKINAIAQAATDSANKATPEFNRIGAAIKSATNAEQLSQFKTELKTAFDDGKLSAEQYETQLANVTAKQNEINQANADAIAVENEKAAAISATSQAQQQSTESTEQATDAIKEQAEAVKEVEESKQSLYSTEGLTNEQLQKQIQLTQKLHEGTARLREAGMNVDFRPQLQGNADAFREINKSIREMESKISDGSLSVSDLSKSFSDAKDGAVDLDKVTMSRINAAVDKARRKLAEMAQAAKDGAESLEIQLARENGDDERARKIEQAKKLADIEEKLAQAKQRGNSEEIQAYERQLELQRQIYQAKAKKEQEKQQQRPPEPQSQKPTQEPAPQIQNTVRQRQQQQPPQRLNVNISEITQAVNKGIAESDIDSLVSVFMEASTQGVINKLREEAKRQR